MEQMAADFTTHAREKLGYRVNVKFDFTPWGTYYTRVTSIVTAKSSEVDVILADSQWLGELYEGGHIISLEGFILEDPELRYAVLNVAQDPDFLNSKPWARVFAEAVKYAKDFWNVPYYGRLLEVQQLYLNKAVAKEISPAEALDIIAQKQWEIVQEYR